ncbi:MAG: CHAT domain-containing protein, partial [Candidatus Acidiferrum sp.]
MSGAEEHLNIEQIECLIGTQTSELRSPEFLEQAQQHLRDCEACRRLLAMESEGDRILRELMSEISAGATRHCPRESLFFELAAGTLNEKESEQLLKHATECDHCGPFFRMALEAFSKEGQPTEKELIESLVSSRDAWRRNLATQLSVKTPKNTNDAKGSLFRWQPAAWVSRISMSQAFSVATVLLIAVVALFFIRREELTPKQKVEHLLAEAYTEHRTLDIRIAGAKYAPLRVERGNTGSSLDKPPSLLSAESLIAENIKNYPNDASWLEAKARADLLDGNYDSAIKSLQRGLEIEPGSSQLLTDLASAYFERAEMADRPIDYGNAIEQLGKVLAKTPNDPVALFNRAIASERALLFVQAVDDWEHYLRIDPQGQWANEARSRLAALKLKLQEHNHGESEPLLSPSQIVELNKAEKPVRDRFNDRVEDYLGLSTMEWLPEAYPSGGEIHDDSADTRNALRILADLTLRNHADSWLTDLLTNVSSASFGSALVQLSAAVKDNNVGDNVAARQHAFAAEQLFHAANNDAGVSRARLEYMFATQYAQDGQECQRIAKGLNSLLENHSYPWIEAQYLIEQGNCAWLMGSLGGARRAFELASKRAEVSGYDAVYLRTQDHLSLLDGTIGDLAGAWSRNQRALIHFWSKTEPTMRGYNLYYDRYEFARATKQPHLQMAVWRSGLALSESFNDNALRAMAHSMMANAAVAADDSQTAEEQFARANQLFVLAPQIKSTRVDHIEAETRLAEVEAVHGKAEEAVSRLHNLEAEVSELSDNYLAILFYSTIGDAESRSGHFQTAEAPLRRAVALSEVHLRSIHDDSSRLRWSQQASWSYRNLVELRMRSGDVAGALELWERYRGSPLQKKVTDHISILKDSSWYEVHEVAAELPSLTNQTVIAYALLPQGLATWIFDDRGIFGIWKEEKTETLEERIVSFRRVCSDPSSDPQDIQQKARTLYDLLVVPIENHISPGRTLVVELDEAFSSLPFEALIDRTNRYIVDRNPIIFSFGVYYRLGRRSLAPITADVSVLVAAVSASKATGYPAVPPLPDVVSEAEMVSRNFRSAKLLIGDQVTVAAVRSRLGGAALFHFAGHAFATVQKSGLLLSDDL